MPRMSRQQRRALERAASKGPSHRRGRLAAPQALRLTVPREDLGPIYDLSATADPTPIQDRRQLWLPVALPQVDAPWGWWAGDEE
jgi:hypothetical protein